MWLETKQQYCPQCKKQVITSRKGTNHQFHLLCTIITCGAWGIVWIIAHFAKSKWKCTKCECDSLLSK